MTTISIQLDSDAAEFYESATLEQQKKLQILFSTLVREFSLSASTSTLFEFMDEISDRAQARGLTPEILQAILDEG